ncbi:MAG TPA: adenylosuccinate lyase [Ignavibacteria bacterium]|jgi:adenylosuccinate lyase
MIQRYSRPEISAIWTDENRFKIWLDIEILAVEAHVKLGRVPQEALDIIKKKANFDTKRILEIEETVKHDVIAFLTNVAEYVGEPSRYIHLGMTSSDILDTALSVQLKQAGEIILKALEKLKDTIAIRAKEHKYSICIGRTHGIHAEPTTFGLKMALWYEETKRNIKRFKAALENISYGKISGAVGNYQHIDPFVEKYVMEKLGLKPDPISTQIVQRDRHAEYLCTLAIIASSLDKFATEIRHLQKTEVYEAEEYFSKGQKGSSAMPHKRNPITCERVSGLARLLRANAQVALENIALWHERDISHSSVERIILPDSTIAMDYMLYIFTNIVEKMFVYPEKMLKNLNITGGLFFSEGILLSLASKGLSREESYKLVQRNAMKVWEEGADFKQQILSDPDIGKFLSEKEINDIFDLKKCTRNVDVIFERLGL